MKIISTKTLLLPQRLFSDFQFPPYSGKEINSPPKEEDKTTYNCWKDLHFNPALEQ